MVPRSPDSAPTLFGTTRPSAQHAVWPVFHGDSGSGDRGSLAKKKYVPQTLGTFPVTTPLFTGLLNLRDSDRWRADVFPALSLGPIWSTC